MHALKTCQRKNNRQRRKKKEEEEDDDEADWHSKFKKTTSRPVIIQEITADAWTLSDEEEKEDIDSERNNN